MIQKLKGSCLCGTVSFEVTNSFDKLFLCSCKQCRKITGSAFASNLFVTADGFEWLDGADKIATYRVPGRDITKSFCRACGCGVPWTSGDGLNMIVPTGSVCGAPNVSERVRIFVNEQPSWAADLEQVESHSEFPV